MSGTLYFLAFQLLGILGVKILFRKERNGFCLLIGSVTGSFLLQWLPTVFAFAFGFNQTAHILALTCLVVLFCSILFYKKYKKETLWTQNATRTSMIQLVKENPCIFLIACVYIYMIIVLWHHTLTLSNGAYLTGQCTYGDMNMHLGFITSIAKQGSFPPEYSILPGTQLAYPFLSDSISSSVYLMGASLKWAYLLPMFVALLQVFFGMYLMAQYLLNDKRKSTLAYILFFFNGGFGIFYFITKGFSDTNFTRIFTEFYQTPTNYVDENIQWHNILVDMLIPQRATLFGWAILFPLLYLLMKARKEKKQLYFIPTGIFAGGLPLIHTHSFLALGVLCCGFLLLDLKGSDRKNKKELSFIIRLAVVVVTLGALFLISQKMNTENPFSSNVLLTIGIIIILAFIAYLAYYFITNVNKSIWVTWGIFLGIVLLLALPQLLGFTFKQATGEQFTRGGFDWANAGDNYIWFCVKNYGIMFFLMIGILLFGNKKQRCIILPASFLWLISEFIVFQPNVYDNNKLLLVSYLFFCIAASDFVYEQTQKFLKNKWSGKSVIAIIAFLGAISAVLTMTREYVSEYELYSKGYVEAAEYIEKNTKISDLFLTATNHNNAIASLTGRNIVCGSSSFLYYHGVDYAQNEADVKNMYEIPESREALFKEYGVNYIVIGPNETSLYSIPDFDNLVQTYPIVFNEDNVIILQVKEIVQ